MRSGGQKFVLIRSLMSCLRKSSGDVVDIRGEAQRFEDTSFALVACRAPKDLGMFVQDMIFGEWLFCRTKVDDTAIQACLGLLPAHIAKRAREYLNDPAWSLNPTSAGIAFRPRKRTKAANVTGDEGQGDELDQLCALEAAFRTQKRLFDLLSGRFLLKTEVTEIIRSVADDEGARCGPAVASTLRELYEFCIKNLAEHDRDEARVMERCFEAMQHSFQSATLRASQFMVHKSGSGPAAKKKDARNEREQKGSTHIYQCHALLENCRRSLQSMQVNQLIVTLKANDEIRGKKSRLKMEE